MADEATVEQTLQLLNSRTQPITSLELAKQLQSDHQKILGSVRSIVSQACASGLDENSFLKLTQQEFKRLDLTPEGQVILENGSHEARIFQAVLAAQPNGIDQGALMKCLPDSSMAKVGFSKAMSNNWIQLDKETKLVRPKQESIQDTVHDLIKSIASMSLESNNGLDQKVVSDLKKRKLITETVVKYVIIEKGPYFTLTIDKPEKDLTLGLLQSDEWKTKKFKDYNFNALGIPAERGHLHPLLKVREQFRQIFLEMGFAEMPTNNFIESSFWNFDTLVVPQAHPARDSQDTFFLSQPEYCQPIEDRQLVERVSCSHHGTNDGSWPKGYQYEWSEKEASRNVLRTHTTAVTARMLYKLANEHKSSGDAHFKPAKFFSIDRVFRNETLDATHLAEFNQVEGVVVDENLTLGDLMGILKAFFEKLGITKLRFKPAYNPYTEPSMEIFSFHSGLNKWVEVGNSGVFRPEMLEALGLPENVSAIAWGLSLERPTMIKYKIDNIRDMVGHKVNLQMVQESPLCLF
jgi:phenylalanyl-tRNA synthetase alpha chain